MPEERPRVAIIDPVEAYRRGVSSTLTGAGHDTAEYDDLRSWLQAQSGDAAVAVIRNPDDFTAVEEAVIEVPLIAVLPSPGLELFVRALQAGAASVIAWDAPLSRLDSMVAAVASGFAVLPIDVARALAAAAGHGGDEALVTDRERGWVRRLGAGWTVKRLAKDQQLSERTMARRLAELRTRLEVPNTAALIARVAGWDN